MRAISRLASPAEHGPGEEGLVEDLIEAAQHGTVAHLEVLVRGLRTVDHNEQATDSGEWLKQSWTSDSRWGLSARLNPERGAMVGAAIDALMQRDGCTATEALVKLAEMGLARLADTANPPRELRGDEHAAVVIHLDAARVPPRSPERDPGDAPIVARPYARIAGGPGLPDRVVLRLLCEGRVRTVISDAASNVLDVGRSHRLVTDRQYPALPLSGIRPLRYVVHALQCAR